MDPLGLRIQEAIRRFFGILQGTASVWSVQTRDDHGDWKRNAGAGTSIQRTAVCVGFQLPPNIITDVPVGCMAINDRRLYFFPDRVLIYSPGGIGSMMYEELQFQGSTIRFIEDGWIPRDATQVDRTWLYVNKNGTPDRRFSNNRQLPVLLYGVLDIWASNFRLQLHTSLAQMGTEAASLLTLTKQAISALGRSPARKGIPQTELSPSDFANDPPPLAWMWPLVCLKWVPRLPEWAQPIVWGVVASLPIVVGLAILRILMSR